MLLNIKMTCSIVLTIVLPIITGVAGAFIGSVIAIPVVYTYARHRMNEEFWSRERTGLVTPVVEVFEDIPLRVEIPEKKFTFRSKT